MPSASVSAARGLCAQRRRSRISAAQDAANSLYRPLRPAGTHERVRARTPRVAHTNPRRDATPAEAGLGPRGAHPPGSNVQRSKPRPDLPQRTERVRRAPRPRADEPPRRTQTPAAHNPSREAETPEARTRCPKRVRRAGLRASPGAPATKAVRGQRTVQAMLSAASAPPSPGLHRSRSAGRSEGPGGPAGQIWARHSHGSRRQERPQTRKSVSAATLIRRV